MFSQTIFAFTCCLHRPLRVARGESWGALVLLLDMHLALPLQVGFCISWEKSELFKSPLRMLIHQCFISNSSVRHLFDPLTGLTASGSCDFSRCHWWFLTNATGIGLFTLSKFWVRSKKKVLWMGFFSGIFQAAQIVTVLWWWGFWGFWGIPNSNLFCSL